MTTALHYDENYAVEIYDRIEVRIDGRVFDAVVTKLHPRLGMVTVRYADHLDCRRDWEPKTKSARVPVVDIDLIGRDA